MSIHECNICQQWARRASFATGFALYGRSSGNDLGACAEYELSGRSHYYAENTRRRFRCRVLELATALEGLLLVTVESVQDHDGRRAFRCVVHDLLGVCVHRSKDETKGDALGFRTKAGAVADMKRYLSGRTSVEDEARRVIQARRESLERDLRQLDAE